MQAQLVVIPGAPLIVSDLGGQSGKAVELRTKVFDAVRWLLISHVLDTESENNIAIVFLPRESDYTAITGSLHPWGSAARVNGGHYLPDLIARWVLGEVSAHSRDYDLDQSLDYATFSSVTAALDAGYRNVLVVADGSSGLAEYSPIGFKEQAAACDAYCHARFSTEESEVEDSKVSVIEAGSEVSNLIAQECGWQDYPLWKELRGLETSASERLYSAAPFGIGYHVHTMIINNAGKD